MIHQVCRVLKTLCLKTLIAVLVISLLAFLKVEWDDLYYPKEFTKITANEKKSTRGGYECPSTHLTRELKFPEESYDQKFIQRHPNLPKFLINASRLPVSLPDISRIRWSGIVYQESWKFSPKFLLYSAHFDSRTNFGLLVRIVALYDGESRTVEEEEEELFCQFWFEGKSSFFVVPVEDVHFIHNIRFSAEHLNPYGITCPVPTVPRGPTVPHSKSFPSAVSLVRKECGTPTNVLKISGSPIKRKKFKKGDTPKIGVCGKALYYYNEDFSTRLIEWVEILKLLGIEKIFLYKTTCHENVKKVLEFYEDEGFVKIVTFYYPPPYGQGGTFTRYWARSWLEAYRAVQAIYLNDCILRNKDSFDYLGVFDSDELIIMNHHKSIPDLFKILNSKMKAGSFIFQWKEFYQNLKPGPSAKNISDEFYALRHNKRTKLDAKEAPVIETNGKSFHNTRRVLWISCHKPLKHLYNNDGVPKSIYIKRRIAYFGHFSVHSCKPDVFCYENETVEEKFLLKMKNNIIKNVNNVKKKIKL